MNCHWHFRRSILHVASPVSRNFSLAVKSITGQAQRFKLEVSPYRKLCSTSSQHRIYGIGCFKDLLLVSRTKLSNQTNSIKYCQNCASIKMPSSVNKWDWNSVRTFYSGRPVFSPAIQKQIQKLTSKRPTRKKTPGKLGDKKNMKSVTAYALAEEYNLELLQKALEVQGLYIAQTLPEDAADALHLTAKYNVDDELRELFFFREGCVVFWNMPEMERNEVLRFTRKYCDGPYSMGIVLHEREFLNFIETKEKTGLNGDTVHLKQVEDTEEDPELLQQLTLQKYAFSNALSLSVKLAIWESSLEKFVESIEPVTEVPIAFLELPVSRSRVPCKTTMYSAHSTVLFNPSPNAIADGTHKTFLYKDLRRGRKLRLTRQKVLQETGELFTLRHLINLSSDLLDTPDFYWDRGDLEALYLKTCSHLNINRRTRVINEKLNHCCELTDLLSSHLNDQHHTRLEWMIIILILVEVVFEIIHYIERYLSSSESDVSAEIQDD